jgi:hypothetical protein
VPIRGRRGVLFCDLIWGVVLPKGEVVLVTSCKL